MNRFFFVFLILVFCLVSCLGDNVQKLYLVSVDSRYGFINSNGEVIIQTQYENAHQFTEDLAAVESNSRWGYIDAHGTFKIKPSFQFALPFKEGKAMVITQNNTMNFIDYSGKILLKDEDRSIYNFQEDRAAVMVANHWGFIDHFGKVVIDYKYDDSVFTGLGFGPNPASNPYLPYVFLDGRIPVSLNGKFGFIDINGKTITDCIYDNVRYYHVGLAVVGLNGKNGLIDRNGKYILALEFDNIGQITDSYISVRKNGKWGFVDNRGTLVIPYQFDFAESFRAERAKIGVKGSDGKLRFGFIDKAGIQVIKPIYDNAYTFESKGYAIVELGNKSGVLDKNGKYVIELIDGIKFDPREGYKNGDGQKHYYRDFINDGIIIYYDNKTDKKGFMRIDGRKVTDPIYYDVEQFQDGVAQVSLLVGQFDFEGKKTGYIDTTGKYIWKPSK